MKKILILLGLMASLSLTVFAGSPYDHIGIDNGSFGSTFTVWVGSVPYKLIDGTYSDEYETYLLRNVGTGGAWYDFDATVSTGTAGQTSSPNGYITGQNGSLPASASIAINGKTGSSVYFVASESTTGAYINVTILKRNAGGQ